jgi:hypothetical protein
MSAPGSITSLSPCGSGGPSPIDVTFHTSASFHGVTGERHQLTLQLIVRDLSCTAVCSNSSSWTVTSGEQGCVNCPVSCTQHQLAAGLYILVATLTDQLLPAGAEEIIDSRACSFQLK